MDHSCFFFYEIDLSCHMPLFSYLFVRGFYLYWILITCMQIYSPSWWLCVFTCFMVSLDEIFVILKKISHFSHNSIFILFCRSICLQLMWNKNLIFHCHWLGKHGHGVSPSASIAKTKLFFVPEFGFHSFFSFYARKVHHPTWGQQAKNGPTTLIPRISLAHISSNILREVSRAWLKVSAAYSLKWQWHGWLYMVLRPSQHRGTVQWWHLAAPKFQRLLLAAKLIRGH